MDRRGFLVGMGALVSLPVAAGAQQAKVPRIAIIAATPLPSRQIMAFLQGLHELGYVEGRNIVVEQRSSGGVSERFPHLVAEALRLNVDVLVVGSTPGALAAKRATTTTPIVFAGVPDPVAHGIVSSFARPGGNITGLSMAVGAGYAGKWVELLKEALPGVSNFAVLRNSTNPASVTFVREVEAAADVLHVKLVLVDVPTRARLDTAFTTVATSRAGGLIVTADPIFASDPSAIVQLASARRLPAIYFLASFVEAGGLMAYGASLPDTYRRAATYVDKILKGAKPAELPVEQPTKFELAINLKTAKALGLTIPPSLLLRADQVIE